MKGVRTAVILSLTLIFIMGILAMGCKPPKEEMRRAENALADARDAGAMEWAKADYQSAEKLLKEGKDAMKGWDNKKAKKKFIEAAERARIAKQNALAAQKPKKETAGEPSGVPAAPNLPTNYVVKKGDCLWKIAKYKQIYNDPYQWPLIYDANKDKIKDPNLIYPKQDFKISRNVAEDQIKKARKRAGGAGKPYSPPGL